MKNGAAKLSSEKLLKIIIFLIKYAKMVQKY